MFDDCDKCGQDDANCRCYIHELEERITALEEDLDQLTEVVKSISDYLKQE